ncbi:MAG: L,D-transpeptidase family protein [Muribaculaceae bacterium]|nr:L,D-transpeptidase family protein [Muribaculaceae bacterium]
MNVIPLIKLRYPAIFAWLLITSMGLLVSCRSNKGDTDSSQELDSIESNFKSANEVEIPEAETKKALDLSNPEDMLEYMNSSKDSARYASGILPKMVKDAPRYADSLFRIRPSRFLVADKAKMKVFVFDSLGNEVTSFRMACAKRYGNKHAKGDSRTPEGFFRVEGVYDSTEWLYTDDNGYTSPVKGQYGPRFIRVKTVPKRWPIGIHGTCAPGSIGGRRSHGCMRLTNDDIMALVPYVEKGMPVIISPSPKDMQVNFEEGTPTLRVWTGGDSLATFKPQPVSAKPKSKDEVKTDSIVKPATQTVSDTIKVQSEPIEETTENTDVPIAMPDTQTPDSI